MHTACPSPSTCNILVVSHSNLLTGIPQREKVLELATAHLIAIKKSTLTTDLPLPRDDYWTNTGKLTNSEHKAVMQVRGGKPRCYRMCSALPDTVVLKSCCVGELKLCS